MQFYSEQDLEEIINNQEQENDEENDDDTKIKIKNTNTKNHQVSYN